MAFRPNYLGGGFPATFTDVTVTNDLTVQGDLLFSSVSANQLHLADNDYISYGNTSAAPDFVSGVVSADSDNWHFSRGGTLGTDTVFKVAKGADGGVIMNENLTWETGVAISAATYTIGRDADATNQMHFNVPTGATWEYSVNDVSVASISTTGLISSAGFFTNNSTNGIRTGDQSFFLMGDQIDAGIRYSSTLNAVHFGLPSGDGNRRIVFMEYADWGNALAIGAASYPTVTILGADHTAPTKRIDLYHDGTNGNIVVPSGDLNLTPAGGDVLIASQSRIAFGSTNDASIGWNTTQTVDAWFFGTSDAINVITIAENGDRSFDFAHGAQVNPTVFLHSAAQSTTQYLSLTHNQTNGVIQTGAGSLNLFASDGTSGVSFNINGSTTWQNTASSVHIHTVQNDNTGFRFQSRISTNVVGTAWGISLNNSSFGTDFSASSGTQGFVREFTNVNQTGTAAYIAHAINITETSLGSGTSYLFQANAGAGGATERFSIRNTGLTTISLAATGAALDINATATTYTDFTGLADIRRSGNLTGVAAETITDLLVYPTFTLTEPSSGTVTYQLGTFDATNVTVTGAAGASTVTALFAKDAGSANATNNFAFEAQLSAIGQVFIDATTVDRTSNLKPAFTLGVDYAADQTVGMYVNGTGVGDVQGFANFRGVLATGGMLTAGDVAVGFNSSLITHASDAADTSIVAYYAEVETDNGGGAELVGYGTSAGLDVAFLSESGEFQFLDYGVTFRELNTAGAASGITFTTADGVTSGAGGSFTVNLGTGVSAANGSFVISNGPLTVDTEESNNVVTRLATTTAVDLKTIANTNIYTVPTGKKLVITGVAVRVNTVDTLTVPTQVSFGDSGDYTSYKGTTTLTNMDAANEMYMLTAENGLTRFYSAGAVVGLRVQVGATATTLTGDVELLGYLLNA